MAKQYRPSFRGLEALEPRTLMSVNILSPLGDLAAVTNQPTTVIDLTSHFDDPAIVGKVVNFDTVMGSFNVELFNVANGSRAAAPLSTAHFLNHVNNNFLPGSTTTRYSSFDNTLVHRVDTSVGVIQGGGFAFPGFTSQTAGPTVNNEYSATRPNTRGTIAFAKQGGNANSATNQWFINTKDNTTVLGPTNNGGFTTFGQVLGEGMTVVDAIAALPTFNFSSLNPSMGTQLPLRNTPPEETGPDNVVLVNTVREVAEVTFTATSDNPDLVVAAIEGGNLVLDFGDQTGTAMITIRATDLNGEFVEASFSVDVQQGGALPSVTELKPSATKVQRGKTFKLTADGVSNGSPGTVNKVEFYRDTNDNGALDPGVDTLLGSDTSASGGWTFTVNTTGMPSGTNTFFTRAVDNFSRPSESVSATTTITNNAPTLRMIPTLGVGQRNQPTTFSYDVLALFADEADANGDTILFRIEQVRTGTLTKGGVAITPGVTTVGPGESVVWTPAQNVDGTVETFSFKAFDGELASSRAATLSFIINMPPTVRRLSSSPRPLSHPGGTLKLSASVADTDGIVTRVDFYRDSNNNGVLELGTDQLLGADVDPRGGWSLTTSNTGAFPTGAVRYFARATDDRGAVSVTPGTTTGDVNVPPTMGEFTTTAPVTRPASITLTAADVVDTGGQISKVEFFLDVDGDSVLTGVDQRVGRGKALPDTNTYVLTIDTKNIPAGATKFIAAATDNKRGVTTRVVTAGIAVLDPNTPPTLGALKVRPTIANRGAVIKLSASKVKDAEGDVQVVEFYRDNGDGVFNATSDTRIARDFSSRGGWSSTFTIETNFATGPRKFFALAKDMDGATSEVAEFEITINPPPTIASLAAVPTALSRGQNLTLTAFTVADTPGGRIKRVEFFVDANGNNAFDAADLKVGTGRLNGANYVGTIRTSRFPTGTLRFFARAIDNNNGVSNTPFTLVTLV